jgi:hypothetical protein
MKQPSDPHEDSPAPFEDAAQERDWLAQERALRRERLALGPAGDSERDRHYRLVARALRVPPSGELPADFAVRVAARVTAAPAMSFENMLMVLLVGALAGAASYTLAAEGDAWARSFRAILMAWDAPISPWLLVLASCVGATWLLERWQQRARR